MSPSRRSCRLPRPHRRNRLVQRPHQLRCRCRHCHTLHCHRRCKAAGTQAPAHGSRSPPRPAARVAPVLQGRLVAPQQPPQLCLLQRHRLQLPQPRRQWTAPRCAAAAAAARWVPRCRAHWRRQSATRQRCPVHGTAMPRHGGWMRWRGWLTRRAAAVAAAAAARFSWWQPSTWW